MTSPPRRRVEVAAAVLIDGAGRFLLAQRPPGKAYEGYWEFPGGKVEPEESAAAAMCRELHEELGIEVAVNDVCPWLTREFDYAHAAVRLRFFRIYRWRGELHGREGQQFAWQDIGAPGALGVAPMLPANGPILRALGLPAVYGITQADAVGVELFMVRLRHALAQGLRLIQIREKNLPPDTLAHFARAVVDLAHANGARVLVNGTPELARAAGADGVHLTSAQLKTLTARPPGDWVAASCHNATELAQAARLGLDFAVMGPVKRTPTHPGAPVMGWDNFARSISDTPLPVYALGGMQPGDLEDARSCGAHGIAMLRGAWGEHAFS